MFGVWMGRLGAMILALGLAGCTAAPHRAGADCPLGFGSPSLMVALFFGRSMPGGGQVREQDWSRFVDQVVTPALPDGFTVLNASGAWLSPTLHVTLHEPAKLLLVSLPDAPGSLATVRRVRADYQARFHQEQVGMSVVPACTSF